MHVWSLDLKLVKRGCSDPFSGKLFHKLFSHWHMLDTLYHLLYIQNDKHVIGQFPNICKDFIEEFQQKRKYHNTEVII